MILKVNFYFKPNMEMESGKNKYMYFFYSELYLRVFSDLNI